MDKTKYGKGTADTLPADLAAVSLCDAKTSAAVGYVCLSKWHQLVADQIAPAPAIQQPRYTRWRRADVIAFWTAWANAGTDAKTAAQISAKATAASQKAREKRAAEAEARKEIRAGDSTVEQITARTTATTAKGRKKREPDEATATAG